MHDLRDQLERVRYAQGTSNPLHCQARVPAHAIAVLDGKEPTMLYPVLGR